MNVLSPDQIPASPQPNTSDSQIGGRKPTSALTTVAVRMNAASPAPSNTPSSAKTTPAKGNWATMNHHGTPTAASTERSSVNSRGSTGSAGGEHDGQARRRDRRPHRHPPCRRSRERGITGAQRRTDQRLGRDGQRIKNQRKEIPQLQHDLVGGHRRGTEAGCDRGGGDEARLERQRPHQQVASQHELGPQRLPIEP